MIDPANVQSVFYVIATANWEKTKDELDNTALCTLALLGLREVRAQVERPVEQVSSGGVVAFRRAQERLNVVLDEVAARKEIIEKEMRRGGLLSSPGVTDEGGRKSLDDDDPE